MRNKRQNRASAFNRTMTFMVTKIVIPPTFRKMPRGSGTGDRVSDDRVTCRELRGDRAAKRNRRSGLTSVFICAQYAITPADRITPTTSPRGPHDTAFAWRDPKECRYSISGTLSPVPGTLYLSVCLAQVCQRQNLPKLIWRYGLFWTKLYGNRTSRQERDAVIGEFAAHTLHVRPDEESGLVR